MVTRTMCCSIQMSGRAKLGAPDVGKMAPAVAAAMSADDGGSQASTGHREDDGGKHSSRQEEQISATLS
jgi:hypothetical protein